MEEEKKKKRNKKKKTKQSKAAENITADAGDTASLDQNHASNGEDDHGQVSGTADAHNGLQNMKVDLNGHRPNWTESSILVEAEEQQWILREATLEETIEQLQSENDLRKKKEASLEGTVSALRNENEFHIQKEATLEETIKELQIENHMNLQKQAGLEMIIVQVRNERDSLLEKVAGLEKKISLLLDEKAKLVLKGVSLEEKVIYLEGEKDLCILRENSTKEMIANLNRDVARLEVQVVELEEFRSNLLQENKQLMDIISGLQLQIQNLERTTSSTISSNKLAKHASEHENWNSQTDAARALVEKLITENAELVEKVNELYVELDRQSATAGIPLAIKSDQMVDTAETSHVADALSESIENLSVPGKKLESVEIVALKADDIGSDTVNVEQAAEISNSSVSDEAGDILRISLDKNEIRDVELQAANDDEKEIQDVALQAANDDEKTTVPLTDSPLVGAPFRFISFVAKYVSGADLVDKNSRR